MLKTVKSAVKSAGRGVKEGIKNDPEVRKVVEKYPRTFDFIRKRLTPDEKFGLNLTIGITIAAVFTYFFLDLLVGIFTQDIVIMSDLRILNIAISFRNPQLNQFMFFITTLGEKEVIISGTLAIGVYLYLLRRWRYLVSLLASVTLGEGFVWIVKQTVERARPPISISLLRESGYSFPSGHAFIAVAFYGLIAYFVYRAVKGKSKLVRYLILVLFALFIGLIGYSRIYLGVHWPSDVLASYAAGAAWITVFITALEIRRKFGKGIRQKDLLRMQYYNGNTKFYGFVLLILWLIFIGFFWKYQSNNTTFANTNNKGTPIEININQGDIPNKLFQNFPRVSETISGKPQEPINIIIIGNEEQLGLIFKQAGWIPCDKLNFKSIEKLIVATLANKPYPTAPGVPSIWDEKPNDTSFEKPTSANLVKERHHIHFWKTPFVFEGSKEVWFGTAHFDQSILIKSSIILPTHSIDPAIDKERDNVREDLVKTGLVESDLEFQLVDPTMGKNQVGDAFFTDGKAYVFYLKE